MKKLLIALGAALALGTAAYADDFVPEDGVKYSFKHKDSELYLGTIANDFAGLQTAAKVNAANYTFTIEATDGGYLLADGNGKYIYKDGWSSFMGSKDKASTVSFAVDGDFYRLSLGGSCFAPDKVADGEKVYSDKGLTFANGLYTIVKSSDIAYNASIKLGNANASIMKENETGANTTTIKFTPVNFDGEVTVTCSEGFTADPATITVADGTEAVVTISSEAAIGTEGTVTLAYGGETLATVAVSVIEPAPTYYVFNIETGLVLGGTEKAVITELTMEESQRFSKIEIPGTNRFYLVQKSSGLYFRNVDSGSGVYAHYCEYGANPERGEWSTSTNGDGVSLKNSKQDRILIPTSLKDGAQTMCYGLTSDKGSAWQLIETSEFGEGEATLDITDENVLVETDGLSFTTEVRAYNLDGGYVEVKPSANVTVSLATIEEGYKRQPLTISTSAKAGTECSVDFLLNGTSLHTLKFTVHERFPRCIFRYVSEGTDMALGSEADSTQPVFKEYNMDDPYQQMVLMPAGDEDAENQYYIIQEGTFKYFSCSGSWDVVFGTNSGKESIWTLEGYGEDDVETIGLRSSHGLLDADAYTVGSKLYSNKSKSNWKVQLVGEIIVSNDDIILDSRTATETVTVSPVGIKEALVITTTGAATTDVATLPVEGGKIVVGLKADAAETSGTVTLTSGNFSRTIDVRLKATTLAVDKEAVEIVGKKGKAIFNVQATDITEPITIAVEGEGFAVNVTSIEAAQKVNRDVTVTYKGSTEATGKVTVTGAGVTKTVNVSVKFNPDIVINDEEFVLDNGTAFFSVTAVDIFEPIKISTTTAGVEISPEELEADAEDAYVFVIVPDATPAGNIEVKVAAGTIAKTLVLVKEEKEDGINAAEAAVMTFTVRNGKLAAHGTAAGSQIIVSDLLGRTVVADAATEVTLGARGIYLVKATAANGAVKTVKIVF